MPLYEYRCRDCATVFEIRREVSRADTDVRCPDGHTDAVRLLSTFATVGRAGAPAAPTQAPCGGSCTCGAYN